MLKESLLAAGLTLLIVGVPLVFLALGWFRTRQVVFVENTTTLREQSESGRHYLGVVVPLHYSFAILTVAFRETEGKPVRADIRDLIPEYGGHHAVATYHDVTGSEGTLSVGLTAGTYDIHFKSTDTENREVTYSVTAVEKTRPLAQYLEVALATVTIGTVVLVEGLTLPS